jgi:hypothetical protein
MRATAIMRLIRVRLFALPRLSAVVLGVIFQVGEWVSALLWGGIFVFWGFRYYSSPGVCLYRDPCSVGEPRDRHTGGFECKRLISAVLALGSVG